MKTDAERRRRVEPILLLDAVAVVFLDSRTALSGHSTVFSKLCQTVSRHRTPRLVVLDAEIINLRCLACRSGGAHHTDEANARQDRHENCKDGYLSAHRVTSYLFLWLLDRYI
jgi:hypothetical protein